MSLKELKIGFKWFKNTMQMATKPRLFTLFSPFLGRNTAPHLGGHRPLVPGYKMAALPACSVSLMAELRPLVSPIRPTARTQAARGPMWRRAVAHTAALPPLADWTGGRMKTGEEAAAAAAAAAAGDSTSPR